VKKAIDFAPLNSYQFSNFLYGRFARIHNGTVTSVPNPEHSTSETTESVVFIQRLSSLLTPCSIHKKVVMNDKYIRAGKEGILTHLEAILRQLPEGLWKTT
jgi:hypothetical protein